MLFKELPNRSWFTTISENGEASPILYKNNGIAFIVPKRPSKTPETFEINSGTKVQQLCFLGDRE